MKKISTLFMSLLIIAVTMTSSLTNAAFNSNKDPNGDGTLDSSDDVYITQYLVGHHEPSTLTSLDVDDNAVISIVDSIYVQMYNLGLISSLPFNDTIDEQNRSNITRYYNVYNAKTGAYKRNYYLSVPESNNTPIAENGVSEVESNRGIVGSTDDRIPDWSNRGVAKIMCTNSEWSAGYRGSGFVVGPHTIATAAHVVMDTNTNYTFKLTDILLFDADHTSHSFTPVEYHIPTSFINSSSYTTTNDYALITIKEDLTNYNSFNLGAITDLAVTNQLTVATVGFPQYIYYNVANASTVLINDHTSHDERLSTGSIDSVDNSVINFTADTSSGNSGGPIYAVESLNGTTYHTVVGINVAEPGNTPVYASYNIGVRFNASILKFLKANSNIQY